MDEKTYLYTLAKDLVGKRVRTLTELQTSVIVVPAGTIATITRKFKGFALETDPCQVCGVSIRIMALLSCVYTIL